MSNILLVSFVKEKRKKEGIVGYQQDKDQNVKGTAINSIQTRIHPGLLQVKAVNTTTCFSPFSYIFQVHCMMPD